MNPKGVSNVFWSAFESSGSIQDFLCYSACKGASGEKADARATGTVDGKIGVESAGGIGSGIGGGITGGIAEGINGGINANSRNSSKDGETGRLQ